MAKKMTSEELAEAELEERIISESSRKDDEYLEKQYDDLYDEYEQAREAFRERSRSFMDTERGRSRR